jgi:DNA-binding transcriptional LysR family regulator
VQHANLQQGEFICDEPLVWVSAQPWTGGGSDSIPLAVYLEGCAFRTNAISALAGAGRAWHVVYTSQSPRGISVAIDSWQTVGVTARRLVPQGWHILDESAGFPPIEPAKLTLWRSPANNDPAIDVLIDIFQQQISGVGLSRQNRLHSVALGHG